MSNKFSCLTVTAGRIPQLEEAIACFLDQRGDWPREMIILNTCPQQQLHMEGAAHFGVRIINLTTRPNSLGEARNMAAAEARGSHLVVWDDDDLYAPWWLSHFEAALRANQTAEWVWQNRQFYSVASRIQKIVTGSCNNLCFSKAAFESAGKYPHLNVGEDRDLVSRITTKFIGHHLDLLDSQLGFIYCWGQGVYHISGLGDDKVSGTNSWQRSGDEMERRIASGTIQTGKIALNPYIKMPPAARIAVFLTSKEHLASAEPGSVVKQSTAKLIHAVERHEVATSGRKQVAQTSWENLYNQGVVSAHYWEYARDATSIGDPRKLPFLKDVLQNALSVANDDDIVLLTNDDTVFHPQLGDRLLAHVQKHGACSSQRCEFRGDLPKLTLSPERIASLGRLHMGRDLFAGTKRWWLSIWDQLPDYILGASDWDLGLASLVRLHHGIESTRKNLEQSIHPAELPRGLILHQFHAPAWADKNNVSSAPSQKRNRLLFKTWARQYLPALQFHPGDII